MRTRPAVVSDARPTSWRRIAWWTSCACPGVAVQPVPMAQTGSYAMTQPAIWVDEAPAKVQVYQSEYGIDQGLLNFDLLYSVGLNIGTERSEIPTCGCEWRPRPPAPPGP